MRGIRHLRSLCLTSLVVGSVVTSTAPVETVLALDAPWTTPTVPPRCSSEQANTGNVAGCVLSNPGDPDERGWPSPPFPGEAGGGFPGTGWHFTGSSYNESPALAAWEAGFVGNAAQIGSIVPGQLSSQPDALPLIAGFLREIQVRGYVVSSGSGAYSFRCTASTRKDCRGLTRDSLSNHAYGLAADINVSQNPMQTNYGVNGTTACQTPMKTDMPQWVIQVAEKWGLYWGGYGWSSGCSSPDQQKSSASRDPMHFEFNGSVEQARAILCYNLGFSAKFEVVDDDGDIEKRCYGPMTPMAGTRMVIRTNAPAGATAALVNLTGTDSSDNGYFTAESCTSQPPEVRAWSNGNIRAGWNVAGTAIVPLDSHGRFCLFNSTAMHSIVDVLGFFASSASAPNGSLYTAISPVRTMDTRQQSFCGPDGGCTSVGPIPNNSEVVSVAYSPVDAVATVANITILQPSTAGYTTADACSALVPGPQQHSNVNFAANGIVANLVLSPSEATATGEQFCTYASTPTHQLIDVQGFFAPATAGGLGYTSLAPSRVLDTRVCWTDQVTMVERCGQMNAAGDVIHMKAPAGAKAVVINITGDSATHNGSFISAGPCSVITAGMPTFSNLNPVVGSSVANAAIVPVDTDGTYCIYTSHPMHVLVDLMGTFNNSGLRFLATTPQRVHDSRAPG